MRERRERVHGPYQHGNRWRVVLIRADGRRSVESFADRRSADRFALDAEARAGSRTLNEAVQAYVDHQRARGLGDNTVDTIEYRLRAIVDVTTSGAEPLIRLTPTTGAVLYHLRSQSTKADTHRGELTVAKAFGAWCVSHGWLRDDPFAKVEGVGRRSAGRPQLRLDEAKLFLEAALADPDIAGLAAATTLMLGARASEITDRVVRDVDDCGHVFWIDRAKTAAGIRHLSVPEVLAGRLAELARGRPPQDPLWGDVDRHWLHYHVVRLCEVAGVPRVTPQGLRGLYASIAIESGAAIRDVCRALGHTDPGVTRRHYFSPGAEQRGQSRIVLRILNGGSQPDSQEPVPPEPNIATADVS